MAKPFETGIGEVSATAYPSGAVASYRGNATATAISNALRSKAEKDKTNTLREAIVERDSSINERERYLDIQQEAQGRAKTVATAEADGIITEEEQRIIKEFKGQIDTLKQGQSQGLLSSTAFNARLRAQKKAFMEQATSPEMVLQLEQIFGSKSIGISESEFETGVQQDHFVSIMDQRHGKDNWTEKDAAIYMRQRSMLRTLEEDRQLGKLSADDALSSARTSVGIRVNDPITKFHARAISQGNVLLGSDIEELNSEISAIRADVKLNARRYITEQQSRGARFTADEIQNVMTSIDNEFNTYLETFNDKDPVSRLKEIREYQEAIINAGMPEGFNAFSRLHQIAGTGGAVGFTQIMNNEGLRTAMTQEMKQFLGDVDVKDVNRFISRLYNNMLRAVEPKDELDRRAMQFLGITLVKDAKVPEEIKGTASDAVISSLVQESESGEKNPEDSIADIIVAAKAGVVDISTPEAKNSLRTTLQSDSMSIIHSVVDQLSANPQINVEYDPTTKKFVGSLVSTPGHPMMGNIAMTSSTTIMSTTVKKLNLLLAQSKEPKLKGIGVSTEELVSKFHEIKDIVPEMEKIREELLETKQEIQTSQRESLKETGETGDTSALEKRIAELEKKLQGLNK